MLKGFSKFFADIRTKAGGLRYRNRPIKVILTIGDRKIVFQAVCDPSIGPAIKLTPLIVLLETLENMEIIKGPIQWDDKEEKHSASTTEELR